MLLWVCFAILTAAVVALLLQPLRAAPGQAIEPAAADLAVYRDQLRELETERERGLLVDSEIESARVEVARRLIKRASDDPQPDVTSPSDEAARAGRARAVYTAIAVLLPVIGMSVYLMTGDPQLPGQPFASRQALPGTPAAIADLIGRVEEHLREKPEDGKGWDVVAPVYLRLGRYGDAAHGFAEASRLEGESVRRLLGFAEATLMAGDGVVTEAVRKASLRVLELEPGRIEPWHPTRICWRPAPPMPRGAKPSRRDWRS
jgi:cytochrome c-type biogenesis protein CcmH